MKEDSFMIEDWYNGEAVSYLHLAQGVDESHVQVADASGVEIKPWKYSVEYNRFLEGKVLEIRFKDHCCYKIS